MSSIIWFLASAILFLTTFWQELAVVEIVPKLSLGRKFHLLTSCKINHGRLQAASTDWHNLLVDESSNYTTTLLEALHENATSASPCFQATTSSTKLEGLPQAVEGKYIFHTDQLIYLTLVTYGSDGEPRCAGGDYFEADFHDQGDLHYRSRLPTVDFGNGSYGLELTVPSRFAGTFSLEIWLLFSNWHGLDFQPDAFGKEALVIAQDLELVAESSAPSEAFHWGSAPHVKAKKELTLDALRQCTLSDFDRTTWQGRWTRNWSLPGCQADSEERFRCLPEEHYECEEPWCFGPVGRLESNGWVYSAHCSFKIFQSDEAWDCLDKRWFFMWGDSNFQDTIRNLLLFVLDWNLPPGQTLSAFTLPRTYEEVFVNPQRPEQQLRVSQLFNGAYPDYNDGEGLLTLQDEAFQKLVLSHFTGKQLPDTVFMNSGLHDGEQFATVEAYLDAVDFAIAWWVQLYDSLPEDGRPTLIWRTTITPAGTSRTMRTNPTKMEMFNQLMLEKLRQVSDKLPVMFLDGFDLTFPFHYDNDCSDGVHYGRAPGTTLAPWYGRPHWYFVDVMMAHIFLNSVCPLAS